MGSKVVDFGNPPKLLWIQSLMHYDFMKWLESLDLEIETLDQKIETLDPKFITLESSLCNLSRLSVINAYSDNSVYKKGIQV